MNAANGGQSDASLDAYLDDRLSAGERAAFRDRLVHDHTLAAQLDVQRRIDHALGQHFTVPPFSGLPADGAQADVLPFPRYHGATGVASIPVSQTRGVIWGSLIGAALFCLTWFLYSQLINPSYSLDDIHSQNVASHVTPQQAREIGTAI